MALREISVSMALPTVVARYSLNVFHDEAICPCACASNPFVLSSFFNYFMALSCCLTCDPRPNHQEVAAGLQIDPRALVAGPGGTV